MCFAFCKSIRHLGLIDQTDESNFFLSNSNKRHPFAQLEPPNLHKLKTQPNNQRPKKRCQRQFLFQNFCVRVLLSGRTQNVAFKCNGAAAVKNETQHPFDFKSDAFVLFGKSGMRIPVLRGKMRKVRSRNWDELSSSFDTLNRSAHRSDGQRWGFALSAITSGSWSRRSREMLRPQNHHSSKR